MHRSIFVAVSTKREQKRMAPSPFRRRFYKTAIRFSEKGIKNGLKSFSISSTKPKAIICHTVKGKGFPFAEHNKNWHHKSNLDSDEIKQMYECLE